MSSSLAGIKVDPGTLAEQMERGRRKEREKKEKEMKLLNLEFSQHIPEGYESYFK